MNPFNPIFQNHTVRVSPAHIDGLVNKLRIQYHQFPGTYSVVAHASHDGVELAIASSPCADPRNFNFSIGSHYAGDKVTMLARDKLWEISGFVLKSRMEEYGLTSDKTLDDFIREYNGLYIVEPINASPVYTPPGFPVIP